MAFPESWRSEVIANVKGANLVSRFQVMPLAPGERDHTPLELNLQLQHPESPQLQRPPKPIPNQNSKLVVNLTDSRIDILLQCVLDSKSDLKSRTCRLYGNVTKTTSPTHVYVDGSCHHNGLPYARAGSGIYWGDNNPRNTSFRVPDAQTNNRGEVYAILKALQMTWPHETLHIHSDSEYAMETIAIRGAAKAAHGWKITNGDLFKDIATLIKCRTAAVVFIQVKGHCGNLRHDEADRLANLGATQDPVPAYALLDIDMSSAVTTRVVTDKVSYLPLKAKDGPVIQPTPSNGAPLPSHRNRTSAHEKQKQHRALIIEAKSEKEFWVAAKKIMGSKQTQADISAATLKEVFERRMNPICPPPKSFNLNRLELNQTFASAIPIRTIDTTPEQFFSAPISEEEIEIAKEHFHDRSAATSSPGLDNIGFAELEEIDNDQLCLLLNDCLTNLEVPSTWLTAALIGIIKRGKDQDDPKEYRAIGLESVLLKFMTLIIHKRITAWCLARDLLPPSQNGFREGFRTNDNVFILRCAIERARSLNLPLYVVFLWLKMRRMGANGHLFDWLRMLYQRMSYVVKHRSEMSSTFFAKLGILIGDNSSPILWTLYLADFCLNPDADDIELAGTTIANLEQADDIILISTSPASAQRKMNALWNWCSINFMLLSAIKSMYMIFGPIPNDLPILKFGEVTVNFTTEQTYVGITLQSTQRNIFTKHYKNKASKARTVGNTVLGMEALIGELPPWEGKKTLHGPD
ncbi:hypothetical protein D9615_009786 [Tricholomella constricta]|uniref:ribonuclease H n=1 Tax=Tricholomella constricta TaxID=117010 RepID=A0A8H5LVF4_9AGAR|nr:hypothetical protein D9615_009786 [Tricholomella constricta]